MNKRPTDALIKNSLFEFCFIFDSFVKKKSIEMSFNTDDQRFRSTLKSTTPDNFSNSLTVDDFIYRARLAEKALRYEDMLTQMRYVLNLKKKLTAEERNLLVVAYKNAVTTRRTGSTNCQLN